MNNNGFHQEGDNRREIKFWGEKMLPTLGTRFKLPNHKKKFLGGR